MKTNSRMPVLGKSKCVICRVDGDAASEFEWYCEPIGNWLCETHCAELQLEGYPEVRKRLAELAGLANDESLKEICADGPFGDKT